MNRFARSKYLSIYPFRGGYTLVEILVATTLSLIILGAVVHLFGTVGTTITQSRSIMESAERLRQTQNRLQMDLEGITVTPIPPRRPDNSEGYLEIIKGPMMQGTQGTYSMDFTRSPPVPIYPIMPVDADKSLTTVDSSVGPLADILMFTTRTKGKPFTGKFFGAAVESDVAEVAWFVRGNTLYRRQLLVAPQLFNNRPAPGFYTDNDISVRVNNIGTIVYPNTLSDLTRRECRYAHPSIPPYDVRAWSYLGLPTAKETSDPAFVAGVWDTSRIASGSLTPNVMDVFYAKRADLKNNITGVPGNPYPKFDLWTTNPTARLTDSELIKNPTNPPVTYQGPAVADDVILTNVIGFDVKVWDAGYPILQDATGQVLKPGDTNYILPGHPQYNVNRTESVLGFGGYVDLGYYPIYNYQGWGNRTLPLPCPPPQPNFNHYGNDPTNPINLCGSCTMARVYDTWSNSYDLHRDTVSGNYIQVNDGFDTNNSGVVDNDNERSFVTPYPAPLRGIQVIIRIFEPDSRQIREVTIQQDFLPK